MTGQTELAFQTPAVAPPVAPSIPTLGGAVQFLASVCDGARRQDGHGFNGADSNFGHWLASKPEQGWTPKLRRRAWVMLRKYRKQLAAAGIDFDAIAEPSDAATAPTVVPIVKQTRPL